MDLGGGYLTVVQATLPWCVVWVEWDPLRIPTPQF